MVDVWETLQRLLGIDEGFGPADTGGRPGVKTQFSATVFSGEAGDWVRYLGAAHATRYDGLARGKVFCDPAKKTLAFQPESPASALLTGCLNEGWALLRRKAGRDPGPAALLDRLVFGNPANARGPLELRVSSLLPAEATREAPVGPPAPGDVTYIVLQAALVDDVLARFRAGGYHADPDAKLGILWPLLRRVVAQLAFPDYPRDRFLEKIDLLTRLTVLTAHVLYQGRSHGRLVPDESGRRYEGYAAEKAGVKPKELADRHPYFRILHEVSPRRADEAGVREQEEFVRILVREFLDGRYLRLSLAGVMPGLTAVMAPLPYKYKKGRASVPRPEVGKAGVLDGDDLKAWRKVDGPFRDMGFELLRQVGMGQFGRVYEALNFSNPQFPARVALKIDRIGHGEKKEQIQEAEVTMQVGRDLAGSPHVIRIYDAGKLKGVRYTYHVLQLVDGDTLDNLVGIAGREHSSVPRPRRGRASADEVREEYFESVRLSAGESWRRRRIALPFTDALSLSQVLDLLTSVLLWLEEVHAAGYIVNDLKNGNLMLSRRGQLKGIDLDSYGPALSAVDRLTDYLFLATSVALFLVHLDPARDESAPAVERLLQSPDGLRRALGRGWSLGDVAQLSRGRVTTGEAVDLLADILTRCRHGDYMDDPGLFSADIDRLIRLKRSIFLEEIVLD